MIITMITVGVMEMTINEVIDMITVGYSFVTTSWSVNVLRVVSVTLVVWCTNVGVGFRHFNDVFLDLVFTTGMMKVTVVQIVHMAIVINGRVTTIWSVLVFMGFVLCTVHVSLSIDDNKNHTTINQLSKCLSNK